MNVAYPWSSFDPAIVAALRGRVREAINTAPEGGLRCPLRHDHEWLPWRAVETRTGVVTKAANGTVWHADPEIRFHASPTYVLRDRVRNFIVGQPLVREMLAGKWGKAETHRLGNENSEDALTWNVFRLLQEADELALAVRVLGGFEPVARPELYLWGRQINLDGPQPWERLAEARNEIEPWGGQQTEPDCCIHVPGQSWLFIEAKFGSRKATKRDEAAKKAWIDRYERTCRGVFDWAAIMQMPARRFPEQLLRNVALALRVRDGDETVTVVALTRDADSTASDADARRCLGGDVDVVVRRATWERVYAALPDEPSLNSLKGYFEEKSYRLRPAFALGG